MKNSITISKRITFFTFLFSIPILGIEIHNGAEAVNLSGKQRMYTQKILKNYAMVGMNNTFGNPKKTLEDTIKIFTEHLISLKKYTKEIQIKKNIENIGIEWEEIKTVIQDTPSIERSIQVQAKLEILLHDWDTVTKELISISGTESEEIINISGRQRMLSQKMASLYMLKVWGLRDPKFQQKLDDTLMLFKRSMVTLQNSPLNTKEITTLLSKVKRSFIFFEMMNKSTSKFVPTLIYKKSNDILKNMDQVTLLYTQIQSNSKEIK